MDGASFYERVKARCYVWQGIECKGHCLVFLFCRAKIQVLCLFLQRLSLLSSICKKRFCLTRSVAVAVRFGDWVSTLSKSVIDALSIGFLNVGNSTCVSMTMSEVIATGMPCRILECAKRVLFYPHAHFRGNTPYQRSHHTARQHKRLSYGLRSGRVCCG